MSPYCYSLEWVREGAGVQEIKKKRKRKKQTVAIERMKKRDDVH